MSSAPRTDLILRLPLLLALLATPAQAALKVGDAAPDFTAAATLGGKPFTFHLADALRHGPVIVYFYPAAFTEGCNIEAHNFAAAMPSYQALGASVIGVSADGIDVLNRFSVSECQNRFAVASDADRRIMQSYDAAEKGSTYAERISYLIGRDGKIAFVISDPDPDWHVEQTLKAAQDLTNSLTNSLAR
jgi:peroxiredoxin